MKVITLIGDIVASKELPRRDALQRKLEKALTELNRSKKRRRLLSPFTLTLGDEFQAVYGGATTLWADIVTLLMTVHPVKVRFALGVGSLSTRVNSKQALGMDGPAFHRAREGLVGLKDDGRLLRIMGEPAEAWALANYVLNLLSHEIEGWSRNRLQILAGLLQGQEVREIEKEMSISMEAIYKNIRVAALDQVVGVCQQLNSQLNASFTEK